MTVRGVPTRTGQDISKLTIVSRDSQRAWLWHLPWIIAFGPTVTAIANGRLHPLFGGALLLYIVGVVLKYWFVRNSLTVLPSSVVLERRIFGLVSQKTLPLETLERVEVRDGLIKGAPLRFVRTDGSTVTMVLGRSPDHCVIADWLNDRLARVDSQAVSEMEMPAALRNMRTATVTIEAS